MRTVGLGILALVGLTVLGATGCTLKATFDTSSDATKNFLSSTTPGAWVTEDGLIRAEHKITAFTAINQSNLEQDIARGQGEYLASLGTLLGVTDETRASFQARAQGEFPNLLPSDHDGRVRQLRTLAE